MEGARETVEQRAEQDVGDEGHHGDVHIGGIDVAFARGDVDHLCLAGPAGGDAGGGVAGPWSVAPGDEDDLELLEDVEVGDCKEGFDVWEPAVDLQRISKAVWRGRCWDANVGLGDISAPRHRSAGNAEAHLRGHRIGEEVSTWRARGCSAADAAKGRELPILLLLLLWLGAVWCGLGIGVLVWVRGL